MDAPIASSEAAGILVGLPDRISDVVLSAIMPCGWWSPEIAATIHPFEGVERDALPEIPIASGQRAA